MCQKARQMIKVFDYKIDELKKIRKRNVIFAISSFLLGLAIVLTLLFMHNRENSLLFSILSIIVIFLFSILGLTFLFILNAPTEKLISLVKTQDKAVINTYHVENIEEKVFSQNGLAFRKIVLSDQQRNKFTFYLEKNIDIKNVEEIKLASVNSIVVSYEVLNEKN